jgi:hypothetical protein
MCRKKYLDIFALNSVEMPAIKRNDAEDIHHKDLIDKNQRGMRYFRMLSESCPDMETGIITFTRAYLACVSVVDECIGPGCRSGTTAVSVTGP